MTNKNPNIELIKKETDLFEKSLKFEKANITEPGEDKIVAGIESGFNVYNDSLQRYMDSPKQVAHIIFLQKEYGILYNQLMLLSQINEKAIELKTDDAKVSAKNALTQMAFIGTFCFLIALSFTYSFASYFNERFFQLYNGIKELGSSNYGQRLYFDTKDEFYDISLVFNEMAEKLSNNNQKIGLNLQLDDDKKESSDDIQELKRFILRIKSIEEQATELISKIEGGK
jgi:methyl-accepting chemotaxis protein